VTSNCIRLMRERPLALEAIDELTYRLVASLSAKEGVR
jgi:hypothetical protein